MAKFKARARTLDMLGRQQIAGIPTAISELFKNAYDAYADKVEIDYFRTDCLFVLRDDGIGMSKKDFISRWLTIGTESKFDPGLIPIKDPDKEVRPLLGEKGVGRLSIATIGPQLLVLTRPKVSNMNSSYLTAAFVNWRVFEWPGINLEDINVPLRSFSSGTLPSKDDVKEMVEEFRQSIKQSKGYVEVDLLQSLFKELEEFDIDPQDIDSYLNEPSLKGNSNGTHFIIKPVSPLLVEDIDGDTTIGGKNITKKATPLKKALLGFSNSMTTPSDTLIKTAFRDHKTEETFDDLIAEEEFFTQEEFQNSDHRIQGEIDEFGQFKGVITIYGEEISDHVIPWGGAQGKHIKCGPFKIDFATFEGENRHSTIPFEEHIRLSAKTEQLGGLYIYRNGIRILPYGDTDFDWLDIELRRSKSAYYYYFSHRKMFGTVTIDSDKNSALQEKAGREGFQKNFAYRQFKSILENLFIQLAADFFREEGIHTEIFNKRKKELTKEEELRKKRERLVSERRKKFENELNLFFERVKSNEPHNEATSIFDHLSNNLKSSRPLEANKIISLESKAKEELRILESRYKLSRPRVGLKKALIRHWEIYKIEFLSLQENVFIPLSKNLNELIDEELNKSSISLERRVRTEAVLDELGREVRRKVGKSGKAINIETKSIAEKAKIAARNSLNTVEGEFKEVISNLQRLDLTEMSNEDFVETRDDLEMRILNVTEEQNKMLESILEQLKSIDLTGENSASDYLMAIEQRNILLEEEAEVDAQLVQLGMAIEIINHEFSGTVRSIRKGLRKLKAWADINEGLVDLYQDIRTSFDHLDSYLTLFTPLQRRLQRHAVELHGSEIRDFIKDLFKARLARHNISINTSKSFSSSKIYSYPSSIYPVFVNLIDNSIFWLSQMNPKIERNIGLNEQEGVLCVSDSGPGIDIRDREAIFEFGFSRKPGGSGMGLYISRETLRKVGFDLQLIERDEGTTFGLIPMTET